MSDTTSYTRAPYRTKLRPTLNLKGEEWEPRVNIAAGAGFSDRTAQRYGWDTIYISNIAYCPRERSLASLAAHPFRRNKPVKHPRKRS